jgi:hypothetical protein
MAVYFCASSAVQFMDTTWTNLKQQMLQEWLYCYQYGCQSGAVSGKIDVRN